MCRENLIILASVKVEFCDELLVFIFEVLPCFLLSSKSALQNLRVSRPGCRFPLLSIEAMLKSSVSTVDIVSIATSFKPNVLHLRYYAAFPIERPSPQKASCLVTHCLSVCLSVCLYRA